jgi:hypothetical protein
MLAVAPPTFAQGKSGEKGNKGGDKPQKSHVQEKKHQDRGGKHEPGKAGKAGKAEKAVEQKIERSNRRTDERFDRIFAERDVKPHIRRFAVGKRGPERIAAGALSRGHARGLDDDDVVIRQDGDRILLLNRSGLTLIDLDEQRARDLGNWRVRPYYDAVKSGAPAFCRTGEGHPVFGREWCLQKGFGLGEYRDLRWGRTTDVRDVIFREVDRGSLARAVLIDVLGDVVVNRLGLHALTLGYTDPLTGVWLGEPAGPQVLRISSGGYPIAEIYDGDRDNRADALVVALRPWY